VADEAERNLISGNVRTGVVISGAETDSNVVAGNYIGTDVSGTVALGNGYDGVAINDGAQANRVGTDGNGVADTAECNLISGNANLGVRIYGAGTDGNVVAGNYIGTDASGTLPLGNGFAVEWGHAVVIGRGAQFNRIGTNGDDVADAAERNVISANAKTGVVIQDSGTDHNVVAGNFIGTDAAGLNALGNGQHGVLIQNRGEGGPQANLVGTNGDGVADEAEGNLISGNVGTGMVVSGVGTDHNVVAGTHIGTDASGTVALGNGAHGVYIVAYLGAPQSNRIGTNGGGVADAAERNVISGNSSHGVLITGTGTDLNVVAGNYIGTDASGTVALGNGFGVEYGAGVAVFSGAQSNRIGTDGNGVADAAERNVISGNSSKGVSIAHEGTSDNVVAGNYIGTDVTGTVALGNGQDGVKIWWASNQRIGGSNPGEGNLISGNARRGVFIQGAAASGNLVQGNYIGTDVSGTEALANGEHGVLIADRAHSNFIGTDGDGVADTAERNIISGNAADGVYIEGTGADFNVVAGNFIGTDVTGTVALGNGQDGVKIWWAANQRIGGSNPGEGNLISGNDRWGVFIQGAEASSNLVQGNCIGTDVSGTEALGNGGHGVYITSGARSNAIGGDAASGNLIAWNAGPGVAVVGEDTNGNRIQANSIYDNGGLGIDLGDDGPTPNAPTLGIGTPSPWQNYPVIAAALVGASTNVIGTLDSPPSAEYTLDFYANTAADPSGFSAAPSSTLSSPRQPRPAS